MRKVSYEITGKGLNKPVIADSYDRMNEVKEAFAERGIRGVKVKTVLTNLPDTTDEEVRKMAIHREKYWAKKRN